MAYGKMTKQQRATYRELRNLGGVMVVTPQVSRQLRALQSRGLVRYGREYGARVAVMKRTRTMQRKARTANFYETLWRGIK